MAGFFFLSALWTSAFAGNGEEIYDQMPDLGDQEFRMTYGYMDRVGGTLGFYPDTTDGCERVENFKSCLAVLRRILGLWNRSMYSNTSALAASSVGYFVR